jgi:pimeloyl-ACP methyl ester carboxylesterase
MVIPQLIGDGHVYALDHRVVKIPGAGHNINQTQPEAVLQVAQEFLASI